MWLTDSQQYLISEFIYTNTLSKACYEKKVHAELYQYYVLFCQMKKRLHGLS